MRCRTARRVAPTGGNNEHLLTTDTLSANGIRMFAFIARVVVGHPWRVIAGWAVIALLIIVFSPSLGDHTSGNNEDFLPKSFESVKAQELADEYFPASAGATGDELELVVTRLIDDQRIRVEHAEKVLADLRSGH